ncbi:integrin beta-PS-like [Condylostylus longicornis]|uniref:integrin beta-PS-like n=1 Tax=Condylostylus longicornis TaxID=2530218 RepID=UPI00244E2839|nr:integrin beta-PS-like [Condylostylus longicornis]
MWRICVEVFSKPYKSCTEKFIVNPVNSETINISEELTRIKLKNQEIKDYKDTKIVQIRPQRVSLKLRPHQVHTLNFEYSQAEDYPIDLYYLMDLSRSMLNHKEKLSSLGNTLANAMKNITRNFQIGFGSFVDKVLMPFTSIMPEKLKDPCSTKENQCAPPYSFIHHMNLTTNVNIFEREVKAAKVSGNIDSPEGGLDAMMQAIVCRKEIGWRDSARRVLVYSSDAGFHYAGDGKLAGLIEPNDGKCHMEGNTYTQAEVLDYPSVSHINDVVKKNAVNIIFAVTKDVGTIYKDLANAIEGATSGVLDESSSNVVDLIRDQYNKITSSIEITDNATSPVDIKYFTSCLNPNEKKREQYKCSELKDDSTVNFEARIEVLGCPKDKNDWKQIIQIYPIGIDESLTIDLEIICGCDCEESTHSTYEEISDKCGGQGTYKCGLCDCNDKYYGRKCECSSERLNTETSSAGCRPDNVTKVDCSGFGTCKCGVCDCNKQENADEIISGAYCECDNFRCLRHEGLLCSGKDHGTCTCGQCVCEAGWSGPDCHCKVSQEACFEKPDLKICSGKGECKCGECICNEYYSGLYCQECPTCNLCSQYKDCVECQAYNSGLFTKDECLKNCTLFHTIILDKIEDPKSDDEDLWKICTIKDKNDCEYIFEYNKNQNDEHKIEVRAEKQKKCPIQTSAAETAAYVILPILALGLFGLLSWKVVTTVHDKREYSKFEKEKLMAKWNTDDNPIYKEASSMYRNPGFNN